MMKCPVCRLGEIKSGTTTVSLERDGLTLVIKEVPAEICNNCGEDYVDKPVAREIMAMAEKMSQRGVQVDVRRYVPGSVTC